MGRKLRASLTAFAIVLGVAMISGTYILTDTINKGFDTIFTRSYQGSDAVISGKSLFSGDNGGSDATPTFSQDVLDQVRALPDVDAAEGSVGGEAKLVDHDGKTIGHGGAPNLGFTINGEDSRFNPLTLTEGAWPRGPLEIAIDKGTADDNGFKVGDSIGVSAKGPVATFRISGIARFAGSSLGGATMAIFDLSTGQAVFGKLGRLDEIRVAAKQGVSPQKLVSEIKPLLPQTAQVRSASAKAKEDAKDINSFTGFLQKFLLAFGGIALFVGSFVIANTLSITIAQRVREFATLRTLGATRRQVLRTVILESLVIGLIASVIGLFLGLALAKGLNSLFVAAGIDLPQSGTVFATRTIVVSLLVGVVVTLLASLRPALRATRVEPIAAVREGATLPPSRFARFGAWPALVLLAIGFALFGYGLYAHGIDGKLRALALVLGGLATVLGVSMSSRRVVRPLASALGWPATRLGGAAGTLARDNAMRNPSRTASTAAALMIGIALVTFVAVVANGLLSSFESSVERLFVADYAVASNTAFGSTTPEAASAARQARGVESVTEVRGGDARAFKETIFLTATDSNLPASVKLDWTAGSDESAASLGANGAFLNQKFADKHHLVLGSPLKLQTPSGGVVDAHVKAIFKEPKGGSPFGQVNISTAAFDRVYPEPKNVFTFVRIRGGVTDENTKALENAISGFPDAKISTRAQFVSDMEGPLKKILMLLYVLLALSVIISLFGIVNTLVLTVFERTRELGMLRAVGMTRRQVRRMIRHESIVTSLIGGTIGIALGLVIAAMVTTRFSAEGFAFVVPIGSLVVFVVSAIVVGLIAAIFPARRASRLNVLEALQYE
jgi:putative ABC transport system permease protein